MFEGILDTTLKADTTLTGFFQTFESEPAIFSDSSPEGIDAADGLFMTHHIEKIGTDSIMIDRFKVDFNIWGFGTSLKNVRLAAKRIEELLDEQNISDSYFNEIRFYRGNAGRIPENDSRDIHYNLQMEARAARKGWADALTTTPGP